MRERGKTEALEELAKIMPAPGEVSFTRQQEPLGLGHAVWCARHLVGDEPFAVLLPDMIMQGEPGCLSQMVDVYNETGGNVIAVSECDPAETAKYGIVGVGEPVGSAATPSASPAWSRSRSRRTRRPTSTSTAATSCSRRSSTSWPRQQRGAGNEIQLTDAMLTPGRNPALLRLPLHGRAHDCGDKLGFLVANVAFALERPELADDLEKEIRALLDGRRLGEPIAAVAVGR